MQKGMVSGGKGGRSSSQRRVRKDDTQERLKPYNVNTQFSAVPDFHLPLGGKGAQDLWK